MSFRRTSFPVRREVTFARPAIMTSSRHQELFEDPDFPPHFQSIFPGNVVPENCRKWAFEVHWKRASELCPDPRFILDGFSRFDIDQGVLGDCWFLGSAIVLANGNKVLFQKVVPPNQGFQPYRYTGQFHFTFWVYGEWMDVVVDDYLPVIGRDQLVFVQNRDNPNEFWPCLLEKAFAKLMGGYMKLEGGRADQALVFLTGGIPENIDITNNAQIPHNLYDTMVKAYRMKSLLVANIFDNNKVVEDNTGLERQHEYSITGFVEVGTKGGKHRLLRILNPWGKGEWRGAWSDSSPEMARLPPEKRQEMMFVQKDDGEFWMTFEDFRYYFDVLTLCYLQPDLLIGEPEDHEGNWQVTLHNGEWQPGKTAGGPTAEHTYWSNPQIVVDLNSPDDVTGNKCTLIVSLMEKDLGLYFREKKSLGFDLYHVLNYKGKPLTASGRGVEWTRDWQCLLLEKGANLTRMFEKQKGIYVIIPYTYKPNVAAQFLLRLFTRKGVASQMLQGHATSRSSTSQIPSYSDTLPTNKSGYRSRGDSNTLPTNRPGYRSHGDLNTLPTNKSSHRPRGDSMSSQLSDVFLPNPTHTSRTNIPGGTRSTLPRQQIEEIPSANREIPPFPVTEVYVPPFPVTHDDVPPFPVSREDITPFPVLSHDSVSLASQDGQPFPRSEDYLLRMNSRPQQENRLMPLNPQDIYTLPHRSNKPALVLLQGEANAAAFYREERAFHEEKSFHEEHHEKRRVTTTTTTHPSKGPAAVGNGTNQGRAIEHTGDNSTGPRRPAQLKSERSLPSNADFNSIFSTLTVGGNSLDAKGLADFLEDISRAECGEPLEFSPETCRCLMFRVDKDNAGRLDADEVKRVWNEIKAYYELFQQFAPDPNNLVDANYLGLMFEKLGFPVAKSIERDIVKRFGSGPSNTLNVKDFILILIKLTSLFGAFDEQKFKNDKGEEKATFTQDEFLRATLFS